MWGTYIHGIFVLCKCFLKFLYHKAHCYSCISPVFVLYWISFYVFFRSRDCIWHCSLKPEEKKPLQKIQIIFPVISFIGEYYKSKMFCTRSVLAMFHYFLSQFSPYNYIKKYKIRYLIQSPLGDENLFTDPKYVCFHYKTLYYEAILTYKGGCNP